MNPRPRVAVASIEAAIVSCRCVVVKRCQTKRRGWRAKIGFFEIKVKASAWRSHDASLSSPHRHHAAQERHTNARCVPSHLRSALGYRDRGLLPRAMRQDPRQPRGGEQVVEGRLQACRCVPSLVRLRRVPGHGCRHVAYSCHRPVGQRRSPVSTLRESRWTSWYYVLGKSMQPRCSPGECKTAEVDARAQPCLE